MKPTIVRLASIALLPLAAYGMIVAEPAVAQGRGPTGVVELFTSQGCSSCPPADRVLAELADDPDILALAYHVDYWNYLGWKDTLASPENTARQYGYAHALEHKSVYTPQAVINGRDHVNGAREGAIRSTIERFAESGRGLAVPLTIAHDDGVLTVEAGAGSGSGDLLLVVFDKESTVDIARGENRGHSLTYAHAVKTVQMIGAWKGQPVSIALPEDVVDDWQRQGCAVLLQVMKTKEEPGPIIGAAVLR